MPKLKFEALDVDGLFARVNRTKIPGGWLLVAMSNSGGGVTFIHCRPRAQVGRRIARRQPRKARSGLDTGALTATLNRYCCVISRKMAFEIEGHHEPT
jgi:hypothetical protein